MTEKGTPAQPDRIEINHSQGTDTTVIYDHSQGVFRVTSEHSGWSDGPTIDAKALAAAIATIRQRGYGVDSADQVLFLERSDSTKAREVVILGKNLRKLQEGTLEDL